MAPPPPVLAARAWCWGEASPSPPDIHTNRARAIRGMARSTLRRQRPIEPSLTTLISFSLLLPSLCTTRLGLEYYSCWPSASTTKNGVPVFVPFGLVTSSISCQFRPIAQSTTFSVLTHCPQSSYLL